VVSDATACAADDMLHDHHDLDTVAEPVTDRWDVTDNDDVAMSWLVLIEDVADNVALNAFEDAEFNAKVSEFDTAGDGSKSEVNRVTATVAVTAAFVVVRCDREIAFAVHVPCVPLPNVLLKTTESHPRFVQLLHALPSGGRESGVNCSKDAEVFHALHDETDDVSDVP
jgi:hypothetical protein